MPQIHSKIPEHGTNPSNTLITAKITDTTSFCMSTNHCNICRYKV